MERRTLTETERQQVLVKWNEVTADYGNSRCLHHLIEQSAARQPDRIAVVCGDAALTYGQLNQRANQLARYLRTELGVGPGVLVALCVRRALDMVVAIAAIWKAGGAYLPVSPAYPRERIALLLTDSAAALLLTELALREHLPQAAGQTLYLDELPGKLDAYAVENPDYAVAASDLAYAIYTSGSTGTPKGVLVEHGGAYNTVAAHIDWCGLVPSDRVLQFAAFGFDTSILEVAMTLGAGATLYLLPKDELQVGSALARWLAENEITVVALLPSVIATLSEHGLPQLRTLISGGEVCPAALAERWSKGRTFFNAYGPTEASVCATLGRYAPQDGDPSIGRPLPNTRAYILDEARQPVAIGEPGELYLGGRGVARSYLNRPQLTAAHFLPDPFCPQEGGRMYRTGDRARFRPDGRIDFLGRLDEQVKIRGFRVEPGEIEAVLLHHPAVKQCVVLARKESSGEKRLCAYVVAQPGAPCTAALLRQSLRDTLPDFMVPAAFVFLTELPLTVHGKVDRAILPPPGKARPLLGTAYAPPRDDTERTLAAIFASTLELDEVGIHDDFFELGGHSLLAANALAQVALRLSAELPVRVLFQQRSVAALATYLHNTPAVVPTCFALTRTSRGLPLPLSSSQEQVWLTSNIDAQSVVYNEPYALTLRGPVDTDALLAALQAVVDRHEILRTAFDVVNGVPTQKIRTHVRLTIPQEDLRALPETDRQEALARLHDESARRPFDLRIPPLMRATLVRMADDEHRLLLTLHHAIFDGVSMSRVFLPELLQLYQSGPAKSAAPPAPALQYGDYAVWERAQLTPTALAPHIDYWRHKLADLAVVQLPTDHPRQATISVRGVRRPVRLSRELAEGLAALAQREGATLYMALLAAFSTLLHRYTSQSDLAIAGVLSTQNRPELRGLIGPFINTVVLRMDLSAQPSFGELLRQVRETVLAAVEHQALPFAKLVEALRPDRRLGQHPLFQVLFLLDPSGPDLPPGWSVSRFDAHNGAATCDLSLQLERRADGLVGFFEYSADLFDSTTIDRWSHHLEVLLTGILADPTRPLDELPLLPPAERAQLDVWSGGASAFPVSACLHELFAAQVQRTPDATALVNDQTSITYKELDRRANRLAHRLHALGIGPDSAVGLCAERSAELVVGIIGILKAGGAYVPLDPVYPRDRIRFMLEDTAATVIVIQSQTRQSVPASFTGTVVCLDDLIEEPGEVLGELVTGVLPDHLAYIIYTSGSTGKPKGVQVSHANVVRLFAATKHWYQFDASDVWCLFHSFAFDVSVWELWGAFLHGGRLVIVPYWVSRSPEAFCRLVSSESVTVLNQTPSAFYQFMAAEQLVGGETPLQIRWVVFAGEALDLAALLPWIDRHGDERPRLINMYGITETTVHVTYRRIRRADCERPGSVIGVPMLDLRTRVLDRRLRPTPIGIPGELFVGGAGVARGYLNRPELTRERFIVDPYAETAGPLYRSGDWVRYRDNGELEYLGRIDHQIKIRGFRVEMGEIEGAVSEHPEVHAGVVMLREDLPGDKRIVAYIVPKPGSESGVAGRVRAFVEQKLPAYMIPSHIVPLDVLPLTQNGKVDRNALPAPDHARPDMRAKYIAPRTFLEEELATIFAEVLSVEKVGVNDSFFDLGGHSLLVIRVIFRVREVFHIELPMRAVFDAPTVAGLARQLETLRPGLRGLAVPPIEKQRPEGRLPLSFAQQRLWFLAQLLPDAPSYNEPVTIRFRGPVHTAALERALEEILVRHEAWRTTFQSADGEPFQIIHPPAPTKLAIADLRVLPAETRESEFFRLCANEAHRPFNLVEGPLVRFLLLLLADDDSRLFIVFHHIVADGLSIYSVFNVELARLYRAFSAGQPTPLPPLPIQYADFSLWQRRWLSSEVVDRQLTYWRQKLGPQVPLLLLPVDHPPPAQPTFRGARQIVTLPLELTQRLRRLGHREGATLFITLLTALKALLHRYVQQDEVVIGIVTAGRQRPELAPLLGFFPNTLVLRTELAGNPSFRDLLLRVREVTLQAFDNQDVPFERVVEALNPERRPGETPLFRVGFILDPLAPELGNDWAMTSADIEITAAKFDLGLELVDVPDGIIGRISYRTELFEPTTIARMVGHYEALLASAANDPDQPLSNIKLLSEAEWTQLGKWGAPVKARAENGCIHELFEAQVDRTPEAPALRYQDEILSYRALDERANRIAQALRERGVGPEVIVALGVERSPLLIIGMLGILKAGGAFLTLDPAYPRDRLAFMLTDAGVELMLSQSALTDTLPTPARETLLLDEEGFAAASPESRLPHLATERSLAYVIYTSGSTGRPKGVLIEHRSLCAITAAHVELFGMRPADRVLQFTSPSFDVAILDVMMALTSGATLVIPPREALLPGPELLTVLREQQITTLQLTPSALGVLPVEPLPQLRNLIVGGEPLPKALIEKWQDESPGKRRIYNAYGPTETTICATLAECRSDDSLILIGRPLVNTKVYVLDDRQRPVPIGIAGELYIGGAGVARGYLARPELTAERFVPSPFDADERLYRTGDVGRWRDNGQLEFIGRADSQVKIRGFRIELGEIDAALAAYPEVREAVVIARTDGGEQHLIAYVVVDEPAPTVAELRHHITLTLPQHMIPAAIIITAELPRTPSGKVDRRALAQAELHLPPREAEYRPPESDLEQSLVAIWQEVLHIDKVGVNDNFFDLGGHSLRMAQVQARLRELLGREVPLIDLFQYPTIRTLAAFLQGGQDTDKLSGSQERGRLRKEAAAMQRRRAAERKRQDD